MLLLPIPLLRVTVEVLFLSLTVSDVIVFGTVQCFDIKNNCMEKI